jgi:hypothetical protein
VHENPSVLTRQDWRDETWARDANSDWRTQFAHDSEYDVRLLLQRPAPQNYHAKLRIGNQNWKRRVTDESQSWLFRNINLPAGRARLKAWLTHGKIGHGPYQVVMHRP